MNEHGDIILTFESALIVSSPPLLKLLYSLLDLLACFHAGLGRHLRLQMFKLLSRILITPDVALTLLVVQRLYPGAEQSPVILGDLSREYVEKCNAVPLCTSRDPLYNLTLAAPNRSRTQQLSFSILSLTSNWRCAPTASPAKFKNDTASASASRTMCTVIAFTSSPTKSLTAFTTSGPCDAKFLHNSCKLSTIISNGIASGYLLSGSKLAELSCVKSFRLPTRRLHLLMWPKLQHCVPFVPHRDSPVRMLISHRPS